jgi:catechol 2,3-dioxygenase
MPDTPSRPIAPVAVNHVVFNVRDIEASHRFWTDVIGLRQVGALRPTADRPNPPKMRFYSAAHDGQPSHHDIALVERPDLPPLNPAAPPAFHHVALAMPDRESWLRQLAHVQASGVKFDSRVEHGCTHSLYIRDPDGNGVELLFELPRHVWENDIPGAVNHYVALPTEGPEAVADRGEDYPVFAAASARG